MTAESLKAFLALPPVRRVIFGGSTALVLLLNKKLGLQLGAEEVAGLVTLALGYLLQSAMVDRARIAGAANAAGVEAAAAVKTLEDAARVLGGKP